MKLKHTTANIIGNLRGFLKLSRHIKNLPPVFWFMLAVFFLLASCVLKEKDADGMPFFALPVVQLSNKGITSIDGIENYINVPAKLVEWLYLDNNSIASLSGDGLSRYTNVTLLSLVNSKIADIGLNVFDDLPKLRHLNLQSNTFSTLPNNMLLKNKDLKNLNLRGNNLAALPAWFATQLPMVTNINLSDNSINSLPVNFLKDSANLLVLQMDNNKLTGLAEEEIMAKNLMIAFLRNNEIATIANNSFSSSKLEQVFFGKNKFTSVPQNIVKNGSTLRLLDLSENEITAIGENDFAAYPNLEYLYLNNNSLDPKQLHPEALVSLKNLIFLFVTLSADGSGLSANAEIFKKLKTNNVFVDILHRDNTQ